MLMSVTIELLLIFANICFLNGKLLIYSECFKLYA